MKAAAGLSTSPDSYGAAMEAAMDARRALGSEGASLAAVFASPHHAAGANRLLEAVHEAVPADRLFGCIGESVIGGDREVEGGPAVAVWLASFSGTAETFHLRFTPTPSGGVLSGWHFEPVRDGRPPPVHLVLADPFTFPADLLLHHVNENVPGTLLMGGMASGGAGPGETALFLDREVLHEGAVGVRLPEGVAIRALVSQGCRPIGQDLVVTRAEQNVLFEVGGRPPLERLRETVGALSPPDRELVSQGLHVGRVIDEYKAEHGQGDFLIRAVIGADPDTGAMAVGDRIDVGETVRFHVRDAATADEELRSLLEALLADASGGRPAGVLLFTCNGRGTRMFPEPDHDARLVARILGGPPAAGFFCAGEIGPVGGKNFLHGFTASLAVFADAGFDA